MTTCLIDQERTERGARTVPITKREALKLIDQLRAVLGAAQKEWHHWQRAYMNLAPRFEQSCADLEFLRSQNSELHRQVNYIRSLAWDDVSDELIVANLRRVLDRSKCR
jgi:hypothetical protein